MVKGYVHLGAIWPKTENCFSPISFDWFIRSDGKSQSNLILLHFGYCSNKLIRTKW